MAARHRGPGTRKPTRVPPRRAVAPPRRSAVEALGDIGRLISATLDPHEVAQRIADAVPALFRARSAVLFSVDPSSGDLVSIAQSGDVGPPRGEPTVMPRGMGLVGQAAAEGRILTSPNVLEDRHLRYTTALRVQLATLPHRAVLAVPLVVGTETVGVLGVGDASGRRFDEGDIALGRALAGLAATAVRNSRLYAETERRRRAAESLMTLSLLVSETLALPVVAQRIADNIRSLLGARAAGLLLLDRATGDLIAVSRSGDPGPGGVEFTTLPRGAGLSSLALRERRPVVSTDVLQDPRVTYPPAYRDWVARTGRRSLLAVPLMEGDEAIGVLSVFREVGRDFTGEDVRLARAFAAHAQTAFANARLHEAAVRRQREIAALLAASRSVMEARDLAETLQRITEEAVAISGTSHVKILLLDEGTGALRVVTTIGVAAASAPAGLEFPAGRGLSGIVATTGAPLFVPDTPNDPRNLVAEGDRRTGIVTYLGLPIRLGGRVLGVLTFNTTTLRTYDADEVAYLGSFADLAAIAIERARQVEGEREARRVTERLLAERDEALRRLQLILDRLPIGCTVSDEAFRFTYWNPEAERIFGYAFAEVEGRRTFETLTPPARHAAVRELFQRARQGDMTAHIIGENVRKDGTTIVCEWRNTPLRGPDGAFLGILSMVQDVTERRRMEEALARSEQRYRAIVEGSIQGLLIHTDDAIRFVNPALVRALGYERAGDLLGREPMSLIGPEDRARLLGYREARRRGAPTPARYEFRALRRDGSTIWFECAVTPIIWDGAPATLVALVDVTEQKTLEEQFRQAQKMEAIGRLAGGVAHDFNNLLTVISGRSHLLLGRLPAGDPARREVEVIGRTAQRATTLTRRLLAFARRQTLQPEVLELNELLVSLEPMLRRLIGEDVALTVVPGPGLGRVKADRGQLEQAIVNLATNARDAMPRGGRLTVEAANVTLDPTYTVRHPDVAPGDYVLLAVTDTGGGMTEEVLAHAFEPFFTTKPKGQGTGLGLAMVYGFVKQSGGHVWVYSEPGFGTSFKVYLPRVEEPVAPVHPGEESLPAPAGSETVLLVEDDAEVRDLAREILGGHGYRVLEARDGAEALAVSERHREAIDLVVTDVVMPGFSGRELVERLRARDPATKALFVSGYTDEAMVHHGVLEPGTPFLQKPFVPEALARKVREVLDGRAV